MWLLRETNEYRIQTKVNQKHMGLKHMLLTDGYKKLCNIS